MCSIQFGMDSLRYTEEIFEECVVWLNYLLISWIPFIDISINQRSTVYCNSKQLGTPPPQKKKSKKIYPTNLTDSSVVKTAKN